MSVAEISSCQQKAHFHEENNLKCFWVIVKNTGRDCVCKTPLSWGIEDKKNCIHTTVIIICPFSAVLSRKRQSWSDSSRSSLRLSLSLLVLTCDTVQEPGTGRGVRERKPSMQVSFSSSLFLISEALMYTCCDRCRWLKIVWVLCTIQASE